MILYDGRISAAALHHLPLPSQFRGLDSAIREAGLSKPRKPERSREVLGLSELLKKSSATVATLLTADRGASGTVPSF